MRSQASDMKGTGRRLELPGVEALDAVPQESLPGVALQLAALQSAVAARMVTPATLDDAEPATDRLLDVDEAGAVLGMSRTWLYKNAHRLPFARRIGARSLKFSSNGIRRYVASRRTT